METLIVSKALCYFEKNDGYEIVNYISGKAIKVDFYIKKLLEECVTAKTIQEIKAIMLKDNVSDSDSEKLLLFLCINKVLIPNDIDALYDLIKEDKSFFDFGFTDLCKIQRSSLTFLGIPFGFGNCIDSGCKNFPSHFRNVTNQFFLGSNSLSSLRTESIHTLFNKTNLLSMLNEGRITDLGNIFYCTGESCDLSYNKITNIISSISRKSCIPFVIGGDHSITYSIIKGLCESYTKFDIIHFDAHADYKQSSLLSFYDSIGLELLNHATVMNYCEKIDNVEKIIQLGVREYFDTTSKKIVSISLDDMNYRNDKYLDLVNRNNAVYLSFDIDYFDPIIAPGTASKLINGGLYNETFVSLSEILKNKKVIGIDLVEINPRLDDCNRTSQLAMNLVLYLLGLITI